MRRSKYLLASPLRVHRCRFQTEQPPLSRSSVLPLRPKAVLSHHPPFSPQPCQPSCYSSQKWKCLCLVFPYTCPIPSSNPGGPNIRAQPEPPHHTTPSVPVCSTVDHLSPGNGFLLPPPVPVVESQNNRVILCQNPPKAPISLSESPRTPSDLPPFLSGLVSHPLSMPCPRAASHVPSCAPAGHMSSYFRAFALAALCLQGPSDLLSPFLQLSTPRDSVSASQTTAFTSKSPFWTLPIYLLCLFFSLAHVAS